MSQPVDPTLTAYPWRITLDCGCVYSVARAPDLAAPLLCGVNDHGLVMIASTQQKK